MTDKAFLDTINENPDDDGPKLVYADWLEEQGNPKGEAIRNLLASRLTSAQWKLIRRAIHETVYVDHRDGRSDHVRINSVKWVYYFDDRDRTHSAEEEAEKRRAGLFTTLKREVVYALKRDMDRVLMRSDRKSYWRKWSRLTEKIGGLRLCSHLGRIITRKIRASGVSMKSLGIGGSSLAGIAHVEVLSSVTGGVDYTDIDPATIPNVKQLVKDALDSFDPWAFHWPQRQIYPKIRERMKAAGFVFQEETTSR